MKELNIGSSKVRVRATPLALLFYKQEFGTDLLGDLLKMQDIGADLSKMDSIAFLQLTWAMAKADAFGNGQFPSFVEWIAGLESIDFSDPDFMQGMLEEAMAGFFRAGGKASDGANTAGK
ncbi:hypothetical protein [Paenibacillus wenxiniae]|uniref:Phage tail assembly chaperone protein, TAC n=1 Tax=Paenibacillus wenxiniae TaxID=1636843 RepID=A0ABW4RH39_9BACL